MNFTRIEVLAAVVRNSGDLFAESDGNDLFGEGQSRANGADPGAERSAHRLVLSSSRRLSDGPHPSQAVPRHRVASTE